MLCEHFQDKLNCMTCRVLINGPKSLEVIPQPVARMLNFLLVTQPRLGPTSAGWKLPTCVVQLIAGYLGGFESHVGEWRARGCGCGSFHKHSQVRTCRALYSWSCCDSWDASSKTCYRLDFSSVAGVVTRYREANPVGPLGLTVSSLCLPPVITTPLTHFGGLGDCCSTGFSGAFCHPSSPTGAGDVVLRAVVTMRGSSKKRRRSVCEDGGTCSVNAYHSGVLPGWAGGSKSCKRKDTFGEATKRCGTGIGGGGVVGAKVCEGSPEFNFGISTTEAV